MLPLESVQDDRSTRDLVPKLETTPKDLSDQISRVMAANEYVSSENIGEAFSALKIQHVRTWEEKVQEPLGTFHRNNGDTEDEEPGIKMNLW